jgi:hypothetical protein
MLQYRQECRAGHFPEIAAQRRRGLIISENLRHLPTDVISLVNSDQKRHGIALFFSLRIPAEGLVLVSVSNSYVSLPNLQFENFLNFTRYFSTYPTPKEGVILYSELPLVWAYPVIRNADLCLFCSFVLITIII